MLLILAVNVFDILVSTAFTLDRVRLNVFTAINLIQLSQFIF